MLDKLRATGVRVALDDFGTVYSSFSQIRRLKFDSMKLDRSLMADLYTDLGAQGVTTAVISMARTMRVRSGENSQPGGCSTSATPCQATEHAIPLRRRAAPKHKAKKARTPRRGGGAVTAAACG